MTGASAAWRAVRAVPYLAGFWLVLSGHFEPLFLALGVLSVAIVHWLCRRTGLTRPAGGAGLVRRRLPLYIVWLTREVFVSSVAVVRRVWSPRSALTPVVSTTSAVDLSEVTRVMYAQSITLTPGTLSLDVGEDHVEVHSIDPAGVKQLREGAMLRRLRRLEPAS